jgi:hypothetical protein
VHLPGPAGDVTVRQRHCGPPAHRCAQHFTRLVEQHHVFAHFPGRQPVPPLPGQLGRQFLHLVRAQQGQEHGLTPVMPLPVQSLHRAHTDQRPLQPFRARTLALQPVAVEQPGSGRAAHQGHRDTQHPDLRDVRPGAVAFTGNESVSAADQPAGATEQRTPILRHATSK